MRQAEKAIDSQAMSFHEHSYIQRQKRLDDHREAINKRVDFVQNLMNVSNYFDVNALKQTANTTHSVIERTTKNEKVDALTARLAELEAKRERDREAEKTSIQRAIFLDTHIANQYTLEARERMRQYQKDLKRIEHDEINAPAPIAAA